MNRLTEKLPDGRNILKADNYAVTFSGEYGTFIGGKGIDALAEYEDLEEQCIKENMFCLRMLLKKWKEFMDDITELYEYSDLDKKGRLLKLPCTVGDKIYYFDRACNGNHMDCLRKPCEKCKDYQFEIYEGKFTLEDYEDFGKWLFLTRKEAESKLKELSNKES